MKSLLKHLKVIDKPGKKNTSISLCISLVTIGASVGIGVTWNPEKTLASACAGVYSTRNVAGTGQSKIGYYNRLKNTYVDIATYTDGENINAVATQPSTGNLFFVNRLTGKIVVYNPNTSSFNTLTGTLPGTTGSIIGATFSASGQLYIYYGNNKTLIEVNPSTGNQIGSTINISGIPGNSGGTTNGDIAIGTDGILYAIGDTGGSGASITSQLYSITISGTTATATPVNGNNNISGASSVNGLAIDPSTGKFYISTGSGTYELNTTTKVATQLTSSVGTNDLAACGSPTPNLPTITKSFSPSTVTGIPANSTLTLTLGNSNSVPIYLIQTLTDNFQSGLTVRNPNGLSGTCIGIPGNTVTAVTGSSSISLNDGFKIPAGGCTVSVNVTASSAGTYTNNIAPGALRTFVGDNTGAASATLVVTTTISGTLYEDSDGDDTFDINEPKLPAITVKLLDSSNNVIQTTTTDANGVYTFTSVSNGNYKIQVDTSDTDIPSGYTLGTPNDLAVTVAGSPVTSKNFGFDPPVASNPNLLLIKRITRVNNITTTRNGDNLAAYIDEASNFYDDNTLDNLAPSDQPDTDKWMDVDNDGKPDLIGGINGGNVQPNDEIEYTVYYLSAGDTTANNVMICDRVPENVTFMPTAFNNFPTKNASGLQGADRGIVWQYNGVIESLSNISDGDAAEYLAPGIEPNSKYPGIKCDGTNTNGVVVVRLGNLPNATAPGIPLNSYGFIRFRGRVK
ncbi:MAG: hypothetical protein IGS39_00020 [Calothrix sp. C42_A2020_038]|nr:hypothetical protein [Calothrix sp. C42_A2020_038]